MTILGKLHFIEKHKPIYDIHYCKVGIGFIFFYPEDGWDYNDPRDWKKALAVQQYYPTFEEAVEAEYQKILEGEKNNEE